MNLFDLLILRCFCIDTGRLLEFKFEIAYPEGPAVKIPVLVALKDLSGFFDRSFYLPEKSRPLCNKCPFGLDVTLR